MIRRAYNGIKDVFIQTIRSFIKDDPMRHAAEIGFYTIFSLPAVLIIMVWIAGIVFGEGQVRAELIYQVSKVLGTDIALQFQKIITNTIISHSSPGAFAVGVGTLIISATTVFMSLQSALNNIWCVKPKPKRGWLKHIINQAISFAFVIGLGFLLLVSLMLDIVIALITDHINQTFSKYTATLILVVNNLFSLTVIMFVFAIIFKVLPDVKIKWKDVWVGSFVTTVLFTIGKFLIGFYLGNSELGNAYGAAGSLVLIFIWVYFSTCILLLGAEFIKIFASYHGRHIEPDEYAVKVMVLEIEKEEIKPIIEHPAPEIDPTMEKRDA